MHLTLSEDQVMIRDAARDYLADASDSPAARAAMTSEHGFNAGVWQAIGGEFGWCGVAIREDHGGMGLGPMELALIQEEAGYRLLCAPFFSTVCLATNLLQSAGSDAAKTTYMPQIAAGELIATAPMSALADDWQSTELIADQRDGNWVLSGTLVRVPDARVADVIFVLAAVDDDTGLFAVPRGADGLSVEPIEGWDTTRRFAAVECRDVPATRCDEAGVSADGRAGAAALTRLFVAAEQLGAAQRCLDLTVEYTGQRKQFGRVIAGFQAVKHRCAQMMVRVEALRSAVYGVAALGAERRDTEALVLEAAMVKALASETLFFCAGEAIQLHGGVGFTWEYDPQLYFKRAQASKHWMGDPASLRVRMAEALI